MLRASKSSDASSGLPDPETPAGGRGKDGRIHNDKLMAHQAAQRDVASLYLYIRCHFLYISMACWRALLGFDEDHLARLCWGCRQCLLTQLL